jgi:hypothetical protein
MDSRMRFVADMLHTIARSSANAQIYSEVSARRCEIASIMG